MFQVNSRVIPRSFVTKFHYTETPTISLDRVYAKIAQHRTAGVIKRVDSINNAVGVLFPQMKELLWFKTYEVQNV